MTSFYLKIALQYCISEYIFFFLLWGPLTDKFCYIMGSKHRLTIFETIKKKVIMRFKFYHSKDPNSSGFLFETMV